MNILTADRAALLQYRQQLQAEYDSCRAKKLKLDMSRGKPCREQLDLCEPILTVLRRNEDTQDGAVDTRNYGGLDGLRSCRALFAQLMEVPESQVIAGGNASLTMMYDTMLRL